MNLPWEALFTVDRDHQPEITVYGAISVVSGDHTLLSLGYTDVPLWSRSLIKPWQLLVNLKLLREHYPFLTPHHLALMMASHNGESEHTMLLEDLLKRSGLSEEQLACPTHYPLSDEATCQLKAQGKGPRRIYHPCSGKHIGMLLAARALNSPLTSYTEGEGFPYQRLKLSLGQLLGKDEVPFKETQDSCGMPCIALTAEELARLYNKLAMAPPDDPLLSDIRDTMQAFPVLIGGTHRLDTRLLQGDLLSRQGISVVAKEGADGLLGVGIQATEHYPGGLGILIKLSSGYQPEHLETLITFLFEQLDLKTPIIPFQKTNLHTAFHFNVPKPQRV